MTQGWDRYQRLARRRWHWKWITGSGPYAVLSCCPGGLTVTLWPTWDEAAVALDGIDRRACGYRCRRAHYIVDLESVAA